ncbi:MAG: ABC transporter permease [Bacteroidetes bacterium]|jgi:ABC-2 type transport system permease protein|nr:ABC transporter permease [Bacteroidota bacterium]
MGKIGLITWREYITRVRKKSFLIMTILGPVLIAVFYGIIIFLAVNDSIGKDTEKVLVYDQSTAIEGKLYNDDRMAFEYTTNWEDRNTDSLNAGGYSGRLLIPANFNIYTPEGVVYESENSLSIESKERINRRIENAIEDEKMSQLGVSETAMDSLKTSVSLHALTLDEDGEAKSSSTELNTVIGMGASFVIYFFIFLYGVQVMKGVIEEKTNRIVEVIVSSVKPFQLMMGKVFGLALVGLTQIVIWLVFSGILMGVISFIFIGSDMGNIMDMANSAQAIPAEQMAEVGVSSMMVNVVSGMMAINWPFIILSFIMYFLGGYLMYSALFAAVGAAVDSETDTQQFMLPITLPLVFSIALSTSVVLRDPNGALSFWLSIIPLTSPIVMMVRAPFLNLATQWWEVALSTGLLITTFCFTIWLAGKIYRTGILMYGKKATYKELFKWLFYKG